jgi:hypothetical protein
MSLDDLVKKNQEESARFLKDHIDRIDKLGASKSLEANIAKALDEFAFKPPIGLESLRNHIQPIPYIKPSPNPISAEEMADLLDREQQRSKRMNSWFIVSVVANIIFGVATLIGVIVTILNYLNSPARSLPTP